MDERDIKIRGRWKYLYRPVDSNGQSIDFLLTAKRSAGAALSFFRKVTRHHSKPQMFTIDKSGANTAALAILNGDKTEDETINVRENKYLNNLIEQDYRNIKRRSRPWPVSN